MAKKEGHASFINWLQANVVETTVQVDGPKLFHCQFEDEDKDIILKGALWQAYSNHCASEAKIPISPNIGGQIVSKIFPNVTTCQRRVDGKVRHAYKGIQFKSDDTLHHFDIDAAVKLAPAGFIVVVKDAHHVVLGVLTGDLLNGMRVMKELSLYTDGKWSLQAAGTCVKQQVLGLQELPALLPDMGTLQIVYNIVKQFAICRGSPVGGLDTDKSKLQVDHWMANNETEKRARSLNCDGALSLFAKGESCLTCRGAVYESFFRRRIEKELHEVHDEQTHVKQLLDEMMPASDSDMKAFLMSQIQCQIKTEKDTRCRRWDPSIIQTCMGLWVRSPKGYSSLRDSGMLILPSESLLQKYKNSLIQEPGLHSDNLRWMNQSATELGTSRSGGITLDEMAIQEDLVMEVRKDSFTLTGLVDMGCTSETIRKMNTHTQDVNMATHILQFMFLGYDGFRWPFAYYPSSGATAPELCDLFWEAVDQLKLANFEVDYVCMDGASANRSFMNMHVPEDKSSFSTQSIFDPEHQITFLMDYSHVVKRLRNNVSSSGVKQAHTRRLTLENGDLILWDQWIRAYHWDRGTNPVRVHQHLTDEHIFLTSQTKMRNHLAEEVLNDDMLNLMQEFKKHLNVEGDTLDGAIKFLHHTSKLIRNFRDRRRISGPNDERLLENRAILDWFTQWEKSILSSSDTKSEKSKKLMTTETRDDLQCLLVGFGELCTRKCEQSNVSIIPASINSDIIENMFSQQRGQHHGANANPSVHQYKYGVTSTILSQTALSKKSNAAKSSVTAKPFSFSTHRPLNPKKRKLKDN